MKGLVGVFDNRVTQQLIPDFRSGVHGMKGRVKDPDRGSAIDVRELRLLVATRLEARMPPQKERRPGSSGTSDPRGQGREMKALKGN